MAGELYKNAIFISSCEFGIGCHELASFAAGVARDISAVRAAITKPRSNGQTEGQITRLELIKWQMYSRAKIDLLQARLVGAAELP